MKAPDDKLLIGSLSLLFAGILMVFISAAKMDGAPEYGATAFLGALLAGAAVGALYRRFGR